MVGGVSEEHVLVDVLEDVFVGERDGRLRLIIAIICVALKVTGVFGEAGVVFEDV